LQLRTAKADVRQAVVFENLELHQDEKSGMKKRDKVMGVVWILLGLTISIWSSTFPFGGLESPGPGYLPFMLGLLLIILGIILLLSAMLQTHSVSRHTVKPLIPDGPGLSRIALTLGAMGLSAAVFEYLGFVLTAFFLILFLMRTVHPQKWRAAVFYAFLTAVSAFIVFRLLLKTSLPKGIMGL